MVTTGTKAAYARTNDRQGAEVNESMRCVLRRRLMAVIYHYARRVRFNVDTDTLGLRSKVNQSAF